MLENQGVEYKIFSFLTPQTNQILYKKGHYFAKVWGTMQGYFRRWAHVFSLSKYSHVFIFREAAPLGPPIYEWVIAKILRKKIVYDFDDAIWLKNTSSENRMVSALKWHGKVKHICRWSWKISCGNSYLADFASKYNDQVIINPTTIDTAYHAPRKHHNNIPIIGWTGTHSTLKYLDMILSPIRELKENNDFKVVIVADKKPELNFDFEFRKWNIETEIDDLADFDAGIMPLDDTKWSKGKCGFKALQYMALGVPALVSPVGVNSKIVTEGETGFICNNEEDWKNSIKTVISNTILKENLGKNAREFVEKHYSVNSNTTNFLTLFE